LAGEPVSRRGTELAKRIHIGKAPVDIVEPRNLLIVLARLLQSRGGSQIVFVRSWDLYRAHHDPLLMKTLQHAALVLPVSRMIQSMARFLGLARPPRYYPFDSIIRILTWLESMGGSLFLLGGTQSDIASVDQNVRQTFPHIRLLGRYAGRFPDRMSPQVAMAIKKADPDILLAGGGLRGRERWLYAQRSHLNNGLMIWSAEWFEFVRLRRHRPVKTAIRSGREWISELLSHPRRIFRIVPLMFFWLRLLAIRLFR
jgi:N-acetylglucosaminyldiphosphoundecaprenol N-acetyl-beta-D-mannosaminyltransferase